MKPGVPLFLKCAERSRTGTSTLVKLIDPLHKWRLNLNNIRIHPKPHIHVNKNPLSGNMSMRLTMYKVLLFKLLFKESMAAKNLLPTNRILYISVFIFKPPEAYVCYNSKTIFRCFLNQIACY